MALLVCIEFCHPRDARASALGQRRVLKQAPCYAARAEQGHHDDLVSTSGHPARLAPPLECEPVAAYFGRPHEGAHEHERSEAREPG